MSIQARTFLRRGAGQITMPHDFRLRKQPVKTRQYINDSFRLLRRSSITRLRMLIQSTLVADTDRTTVERSRMRPHFEQEAMLRHATILADVEVVAHIIETTALMVASKLFHTIVLVASSSRAVQDQKLHGVGIHHQFAVLHSGEECAFITHQLLPQSIKEIFLESFLMN